MKEKTGLACEHQAPKQLTTIGTNFRPWALHFFSYLGNFTDSAYLSAALPECSSFAFELSLTDAWVWDVYRSARFVKSVRVVTFKDVNVEELAKSDLEVPKPEGFAG